MGFYFHSFPPAIFPWRIINMLLKKINSILFLILIVSIFPGWKIYADDYVLPYPSYMPGNTLYKVSRMLDKVQNFWYWGNLAQEKYHLGLSDKYLVEAKVLFEYHQYLLAVNALKRSNEQYLLVHPYIAKAAIEGKDIRTILHTFIAATVEHERVLDTIKQQIPQTFTWNPEKDKPTHLLLHNLIDEAVALRKKEILELN